MSSAQVGAVLRQIRKLADARHDPEAPDHDLLERFARDRDEGSFAALLRRHGPMVLSVCRSVLHDPHDAEDAFQAAFLLLARKADSIHQRDAVSAWLYRVAYRLAVRARANAARRKVIEKRAVTMPTADPVLDMSLREVRGVLFELENLPEKYRAPLVLCGLEEKSVEHAARLLGWTVGAVKGRLQRGRELLRNRARRRGLELPAALSAIALALGTAADRVSAALADSTLRAAVQVAAGGVVSPEVAALVEGAGKTILQGKARIATILSLALGVAATFVVVWNGASAADPPSPPTQAERPKDKAARPLPDKRPEPAAGPTVEVPSGRVLGPDGKPCAGAKLYVGHGRSGAKTFPVRTTSGAEGRFAFTVARVKLDDAAGESLQLQVMAIARGHGCDWAQIGSPKEELTLRLVKDVPIRGRILDPDGRPVAGARLTVTGVSAGKGDDLGGYVEAVRKGDSGYELAKVWAGPLLGQPAVLTTGADGRFKLSGAGRERVVHFDLEGPATASVGLEVMTRPTETVAGHRRRLFGASFDYVAVASRPIRGVVRDKDTGKPLAGVSVRSWTNSRCKAITDRQGRYELVGLAKATRYWLRVKPPDGLFFGRQVGFEDTPGLGGLAGDIELVRGLTVRGKVTDKATGKPVAQARVEYYPLFPNPKVNTKLAGRWVPRAEAVTGADGSYALTVLPGPGVIGVTGPRRDAYMTAWVTLKERNDFFKGSIQSPHETVLNIDGGSNLRGAIAQDNYHALVLLEPGEKDKALEKNVALEPGRTRKGRVVGPDGRPLTGVTVFGLVQLSGKKTLKGSEFTVRLNPRAANRPLVFCHKEKGLGFYLKGLPGEKTGPLTVKLQPCGSANGRLVDASGAPVAGARLDVGGVTTAQVGGGFQQTTTDKKGRFRIDALVPGFPYHIMVRGAIGRIFATATVEPGKHKDLGDVKLRE